MNYISLILLLYALTISSAHAYIGPGMGGGVIAAIFGVIAAIFLALFGILYYPLKRAYKKRHTKVKSENEKDEDEDEK